ncbi:hypothetical protein F3B08_24285, partial [Salmonella enterica subsp. enterica serovar Typhi]|nr:hypothetical protein [Salmonella enterica subsp. enterica serovar Typhi]
NHQSQTTNTNHKLQVTSHKDKYEERNLYKMHAFKALAALAFAVPVLTNPLLRRQCAETCGSTCYSQDDINAAVQQGYSDYEDGTTVGNDNYPHQYNDYEGFSFPDAGPYYEFPILADEEVYTGGSPGADRVIFTGDGTYEGVITHTGASGNDFLQCTAD